MVNNIQQVTWNKFAANCIINPLLAMTAPMAHCFDNTIRARILPLAEEICAIAQTLGLKGYPEQLVQRSTPFVHTPTTIVPLCVKTCATNALPS